LDAIAINAAIVGLRAGQFRSHLMRERPKTIQRLYEEFEKYCRSDNDFRMCMEEQSQQKKVCESQSTQREGVAQSQKHLTYQSSGRFRPGWRKHPRKSLPAG
jgi:hypothetical protein